MMAGSMERRGDSWRFTVSAGFDDKGKRLRYYKTFKGTKSEAKKELAKFVAAVDGGQVTATGKMLFKDFAQIWLRDHAESNLAAKTVFRYKQILEARVYNRIGGKKLEDLRPVDLVAFYKYLEKEAPRLDNRSGGLSGKTILQHHRLISSILQTAVHWQIITHNVADRVKPPKVEKNEARCFDDAEALKLIGLLEDEPLKYRTAITLLLASGLRRGELMGLEWADVNFEESSISVRRTSQYIEKRGVFTKEPKNEHSFRTITLPSFAMQLLQVYRKHWLESRLEVGDLWQGSDRLFVTWDGKPMHPSTIGTFFRRFLEKHNLPAMPLHSLRHSAASIMISEGLDLPLISKRLGHADVSTTGNIYGHLFKSADKRAAETLNGFFSKVKE